MPRGVGAGVYECRIDFGPGYRVYFSKDEDTLVISWEAARRETPSKDIQAAHERSKAVEQRKAEKSSNAIDP